jgi:hypothetical protein
MIMKKMIYTAVALFLLSFSGYAQQDAISKYFSEYEDRDDVMSVVLSGKAFELAENIETGSEEGKSITKLASQIDRMRVIVDEGDPDAKTTASRAQRLVKSDFESLITFTEKDALINIMVRESDGIVYEVLGIVGKGEDFILASVIGEMNLSDVGDITRGLAKVGPDIFSGTEFDKAEISLYPNPVQRGENISLKLPERFNGSTIRVFDTEGSEVYSFKYRGGTQQLSSSKLGKGVFLLKAGDNEVQASRKFIVK